MELLLFFVMASVTVAGVTELWHQMTARYMVWACNEVPGLLELPKGTLFLPPRGPIHLTGKQLYASAFYVLNGKHGWNEKATVGRGATGESSCTVYGVTHE